MMENFEDASNAKTTSDFILEMMTDEKDGEEFTREYLKAKFLNSAVHGLYNVRRKAGITQAQVAEKLNTKQAVIARLEANTEGTMSLHRYVEYALACGMIPHQITFVSLDDARNYIKESPKTPETEVNFTSWLAKVSKSTTIPSGNTIQQEEVSFEPGSTTAQAQHSNVFSFEMSPEAQPTATFQEAIATQNFFQPPLLRSLQLVHSGNKMSTPSEPPNKTLTMASQSHTEVVA